tara:strand:+ start:102065 stop:102586 length:522 start_codon:yes stop_codon:yes gene_type:complete
MDPKNVENVRTLVLGVLYKLQGQGHDIGNEFPSKDKYRINLYSEKEESLELAIQKLYDHKHSPLRGHEKVKSFDLEIEILEDDGYLLNCLFEEEKIFNRRLTNMLSTSAFNHEKDIQELEQKIKSINDYLSNSGIIHYKNFMVQFIEMLGHNQLLPNTDYVKERMFNSNENTH